MHKEASAQTTPISGIVNSYYAVTEILPANDGLKVANPSGLGFHDKVMIIQMKGASVSTGNNSSFGDTTSLNDAGNYEIATICSIGGDTVYFFFNLLNHYTITGKVQLVKFAQYSSAIVTDTIKAMPWDNSSGTGGVIAISVTDDLTLDAPISGDSSGFRGGVFKKSGGSCGNGFPIPVASSYFYDANSLNPQNGAFKGESVYDFPAAQSGGRGAAANGGGGGNNHNNGGAGGANLSAGGNGGGNSSSAGCTASNQGIGGKPLSSWSGNKIFLGGGGGAGHMNDGAGTFRGGGHGGAIIFLQANNFISNTQKISANGESGGASLVDGASGGGAGGTIIMNILNSYSGTISIEANGGTGGTADDGGTINRCYGAGGGGSGGVLYFTGSFPIASMSYTAGIAGAETGRNAGCHAVVPALAGVDGSRIASYTYNRSFDPAGSCHSVLPLQLLAFKARGMGEFVQLNWQLSHPELGRSIAIQVLGKDNRWKERTMIETIPLDQFYNWIDSLALPGINEYRLKIIEKDYSFFYSPVRQVLMTGKENLFSVYPNPASNRIHVTGDFSKAKLILLTDLMGRIVKNWDRQTMQNDVLLEMPAVPAGVYLLHIGYQVIKVVRQKEN